MIASRLLARAIGSAFIFVGLCVSCGDDDDGMAGAGVGPPCANHGQCRTGHCCRNRECGGGMCTYTCGDDRDCPPSTLCQHGVCFFACRGDLDCARGQSCEHDGVCEWN